MDDYSNIETEVKNWLENKFPIGEETRLAVAVTGESYISFCIGGIKAEGTRHTLVASSPVRAADGFIRSLEDFIQDKVGILYWRIKPKISEEIYYDLMGEPIVFYQMYARFLISDAPIDPNMINAFTNI